MLLETRQRTNNSYTKRTLKHPSRQREVVHGYHSDLDARLRDRKAAQY